VNDLLASILAASDPYGWHPFLTPMPVWDYWFWLLLPLALGVAITYKTTKCASAAAIPREGALLALWIVTGLIAAAAAVAIAARYA
jgi:hypothetical protein